MQRARLASFLDIRRPTSFIQRLPCRRRLIESGRTLEIVCIQATNRLVRTRTLGGVRGVPGNRAPPDRHYSSRSGPTSHAQTQPGVFEYHQESRVDQHQSVPRFRDAFGEFRRERYQLSVSGSLPTTSRTATSAAPYHRVVRSICLGER